MERLKVWEGAQVLHCLQPGCTVESPGDLQQNCLSLSLLPAGSDLISLVEAWALIP